jgi:hypothetical protein
VSKYEAHIPVFERTNDECVRDPITWSVNDWSGRNHRFHGFTTEIESRCNTVKVARIHLQLTI